MSLDCFMSLQSIKKILFLTSNNRLKILQGQALKENLEEISIVTEYPW